MAPALLLGLTGASAGGALDVDFQGVRNARGIVRICVTRDPAYFPRCQGDPNARRLNVPANRLETIHVVDLDQGSYAIAAIHDENGNGRLDTFLGIPREGFAFSRNPRVGFGPPRFEQVRFTVGPGGGTQSMRFRYIG